MVMGPLGRNSKLPFINLLPPFLPPLSSTLTFPPPLGFSCHGYGSRTRVHSLLPSPPSSLTTLAFLKGMIPVSMGLGYSPVAPFLFRFIPPSSVATMVFLKGAIPKPISSGFSAQHRQAWALDYLAALSFIVSFLLRPCQPWDFLAAWFKLLHTRLRIQYSGPPGSS